MVQFRDFIDGPWRAVPVLGITQIIAWGAIFYTPVLIVPLIAAERGWSISFAMGGFSLGLLTAGIAARYIGGSIDRFGGHVTMTCGSLGGALGLVLITHAANPVTYSPGVDAARPVDGGEPLRRRLRQPRPHLRHGRAAADHGADARRRLRLDGELAGDASADREHRLARLLSRLCRGARLGERAAACLAAAARTRQRRGDANRTPDAETDEGACRRRA